MDRLAKEAAEALPPVYAEQAKPRGGKRGKGKKQEEEEEEEEDPEDEPEGKKPRGKKKGKGKKQEEEEEGDEDEPQGKKLPGKKKGRGKKQEEEEEEEDEDEGEGNPSLETDQEIARMEKHCVKEAAVAKKKPNKKTKAVDEDMDEASTDKGLEKPKGKAKAVAKAGKGEKGKGKGQKSKEEQEKKGEGKKSLPKQGSGKRKAEEMEEEQQGEEGEEEDEEADQEYEEEGEEESAEEDKPVKPGFRWPDMEEDRWTTGPKDKVFPPSHVDGNHVYSSAYKKAQRAGMDLENAKSWGRYASQFFKKYGWVPQKYIGAFRKGRAKATAKAKRS